MQLPDGTVLMHGLRPYDPAKAHEYYLKTRHLKGRKPGAGFNKSGPVGIGKFIIGPKPGTSNRMVTVHLGNGKTIKLTQQQLTQQKAYAAARVNSIKNRLGQLNAELKKRIAAAQAPATKKVVSPAQKALANRKAKAYVAANKQKIATKKHQKVGATAAKAAGSNLAANKSVADLRKVIAGVQHSLAAAVAKQRALATAK